MSVVRDGIGVAEGISFGPIRVLNWGMPDVPHQTLDPSAAELEVTRFAEAREWARARLLDIQAGTEEILGPLESRIFEPQLLMLEDPEVVDGTVRYIRENHLTAARAFYWRMLELQAQWVRTSNPMVLDRLSDLEDLMVRVLHHLLDLREPTDLTGDEPSIVVARNLTPSLTVQMDPEQVLGIAADEGTRTSHWAILARSMGIPAVAGMVDLSRVAHDGQQAILDGRFGRLILDPDDRDHRVYRDRKDRIEAWEEELGQLARLDAVTVDGQPVALRANIDVPAESGRAASHGAEGVGLFRTEFLDVGRNAMPPEEEQYEAYRQVAAAFPGQAVIVRTFDLGGDKFPTFLHMPAEENPFLGWRAIRVCLDRLELFRPQIRALLRATAHGDVRIMLPLVNDVEEVIRVRELISEEEQGLRRDGIPFSSAFKLGVLIETPAAALDAAELARYSDFFSIGTNDLIQYTLAVDRTNARLASLYNPFHPAVVRQIHQVSRAARAAGIEVSVCGEMAATPLGAFLLLGLDITTLSVAWPSLPEVKKVIRAFRMEDARAAAKQALGAATSKDVTEALVAGLGGAVDLEVFSGRWNLSLPGGSD
ncbi:MAG: phosphoenolpyruvate--protein phosphotransferase [Gemmatimonadota bacterium]